MQFFDFHAHIILKQVFQDPPNIGTLVYQEDVSTIPKACTDLPNIIETQSHQTQLETFDDPVIIGAVLYGLESNLALSVIPLRSYLKDAAQPKLSGALLSSAARPGYATFTDFVLTRTFNQYQQNPGTFNLLTKDSFSAPLPKDKVNVFFTVEGCHSLVDTINQVSSPSQGYDPLEILKNLDLLLGKVKITSVNLTHMQQSNMCNHAFGMQIASPEKFFPTGDGLTDAGRQVIQGLFDRGVSVDLKHMSYKSRQELRAEIAAGNYRNVQPPMCTHAGFTGISFAQWPGYISCKDSDEYPDVIYLELAKTMQTKNGPPSPGTPAFNMTTINLFDDDIVWIVKSNGMIGLSMDRRILGFVSKFDDSPTGKTVNVSRVVDKEYISKTEWLTYGITDDQIGSAVDDDDCVQVEDVGDLELGDIPDRDEYFNRHVLLHIKHYFQACVDAGIPVAVAGKHLSIGSDFDGLINPFINTSTCLQMAALKKYVADNLGEFLHRLRDSEAWADQLDVASFVEDLFYNNGFNFVKGVFGG